MSYKKLTEQEKATNRFLSKVKIQMSAKELFDLLLDKSLYDKIIEKAIKKVIKKSKK